MSGSNGDGTEEQTVHDKDFLLTLELPVSKALSLVSMLVLLWEVSQYAASLPMASETQMEGMTFPFSYPIPDYRVFSS